MAYKGGEGLKKPSQTKNTKNIRHIVIHHSATPQTWTIDDFVKHRLQTGASGSGKYSGLGYNYVAFPTQKKVIADVPDNEMTWSTGGYNSYSLAICVAGYYHAPFNHAATTEIIEMLSDKCVELCVKYHLDPYKAIIGHRDVAGIIKNNKWATACPGDILYSKLKELRIKTKDKLDKMITPHAVIEDEDWTYDPSLCDEDYGDTGQSIMF